MDENSYILIGDGLVGCSKTLGKQNKDSCSIATKEFPRKFPRVKLQARHGIRELQNGGLRP